MKIVVTGAAGFIGSNLVHGLNAAGISDIIAVDDLSEGQKFRNIATAGISDYFDREEFYTRFAKGDFGKIDAVLHQGACSDTMEHDGRFMMEINYRCSKDLLDHCARQGARLLYASSAAVYGNSQVFVEEPQWETPLNVYGYSKLLFDNVVRRALPALDVQVAGFRYFNVYGPREEHKGRMASVARHNFSQLEEQGSVKLFGGYADYAAGEQSRDFIFVEDVVATNLWFLEHPEASGIFNLGTGRAQPFNDIAHATINAWRKARQNLPALSLDQQISGSLIDYIEFPEALKGRYQSFTQADISRLRQVGYHSDFATVEQGVSRYVSWLAEQPLI